MSTEAFISDQKRTEYENSFAQRYDAPLRGLSEYEGDLFSRQSQDDAVISDLREVCRMRSGRTFEKGTAEMALADLLSAVLHFARKMEKEIRMKSGERTGEYGLPGN